jgi:AraC-like DNA-binding protein
MEKSTSSAERLPRLAFGEAYSTNSTSLMESAEGFCARFTGTTHFESVLPVREYRSKMSVLELPGMEVVARATTPTRVACGELGEMTFYHLLSGTADITFADGNSDPNRGPGFGLTQNGVDVIGKGTRNYVAFSLSRRKLEQTKMAMLGPDADLKPLRRRRREECVLPVTDTIHKAFLSVYQIIDAFQGSTAAMHAANVEDTLTRLIVMALCPEIFLTEREPRGASSLSTAVDAMCELMRENISRPMSLTEMELKSGYSKRALQYEFNRRFGQSPTEWQLSIRLEVALSYLSSRRCELQITEIARKTGFSSISSFSYAFRKKYGLAPSSFRAQ